MARLLGVRQRPKSSTSFSQDELEVLVKDEEEKIKARFKNTLGLGLLAFLGLS